jgi:UDP-glucose 4-epimerase
MSVLVVGGAGYIGSHMVELLLRQGAAVRIFDNFSTGHRDAIAGGTLIEGDLLDPAAVASAFAGARVDAVIHFGAFTQVAESVRDPGKYYWNNVAGTLSLLQAVVHHGVRKFVFSSSAAVFGEPLYAPIDEAHPKRPINPYGRSKLYIEEMLQDFDRAYGLRSVSLRYFNAAGADPAGRLGERHEPETHLVPLVLQAASGRREAITIFGDDYDTPDGTCVRDYIHVADLCTAHLAAMDYLEDGATTAFNLGNGAGFSIRAVIEAAQRVTGRPIPARIGARRPGDPAVLVADARQARERLGWQPRFPALESIIEHAWAWEERAHVVASR